MPCKNLLRRGCVFIFAAVVIFMLDFVSAAAPNVTFNFQQPSDISSTNLMANLLNISYNISGADLNASSVTLYYKSNTTTSDCSFFVNGTQSCGFRNDPFITSNVSEVWLFRLNHITMYGGTYNYDQFILRDLNKTQYDLDANGEFVKIQFLNVSNSKNFNYLFFNADNQTALSNSLRMYYCNSSYVSGNPMTSTNCVNFYNMEASEPFEAEPTIYSRYHAAPFPINKTTGRIGNVYVTDISYFLLRGRMGVNAWNVAYIPNVSRTGAMQVSTNTGTAWTNFNGTFDAHFHQFDGTEIFYYYACASDTSGNQNCSSLRQDSIETGGLPPAAAEFFSPLAANYSGNLSINYTPAVSPNNYHVNYYNISLMFPHDTHGNESDDAFFRRIVQNNSDNLSYIFDTIGVPDGYYNIHITACDSLGQCSLAESENFIIDNSPPAVALSCSPLSVSIGGTISCSCDASDSPAGIASKVFESSISPSSEGSFVTVCTVTDTAGNIASKNVSYSVTKTSGGGGGGGGGGFYLNQKTVVFSQISPSVPESVKEFRKEIGIEEINIYVREISNNVQITITRYQPETKKEGKVYQYYSVSAKNLENLSRAQFILRVEKSWMVNNSVDRNNLSLFRFNESSKIWTELPTSYQRENADYYYYAAETVSFSDFAVGEGMRSGEGEVGDEEEIGMWPEVDARDYIPRSTLLERMSYSIRIISILLALVIIVVLIIILSTPLIKKLRRFYVRKYARKSLNRKSKRRGV